MKPITTYICVVYTKENNFNTIFIANFVTFVTFATISITIIIKTQNMKKLVLTLAIGIFFVSFANAQTADKKAEVAKQAVELTASSDDKPAADKKTKTECATDKKAKTECATDKKTKTECATDKKAKSKKASLRPSACADKNKSSCKDKKSSCKDKK